MFIRGFFLAIIAAFAIFVFALIQLLSSAGVEARLLWLIGMLMSVVSALAIGALGLTLRWQGQADRRFAPLMRGLAQSDIGLLFTDAQGVTLYANPAFPEALGLEPGPDLLGALEVRLGFLDQDPQMLSTLRAQAAQGFGDCIEIEAQDVQGETSRRRLRAEPLADGQGVMWSLEDVSGAAVAAKTSPVVTQIPATPLPAQSPIPPIQADLGDVLMDLLPVGVLGLDETGSIVYVNRRMANWLGGEAGLFSDGRTTLSDLVIGDSVNGEVSLKTKGGEPFRCSLVHGLVGDEQGAGRVRSQAVAFPDPMPSHEWEYALAESERKIRWLFDESPVPIVIGDLAGQVSAVNAAFLEAAGQRREAVLGCSVVELIQPEDRDEMSRHLSKAVMGMAATGQLEARIAGARGILASVHIHRMAGRSGESGAIVLHFIDATEQKNLEEQFAQSQKMQAVGQLAGGVAHDFNNLLTAMIGFCDLLLSRHGAGDPSFADIMQIKQNANRAANLVRQLLAFSRRQTLQPKVVNITDALADMSNLMRRLIGEKIDLDVKHGRELSAVKVDPGQLDQVIINLVVNARDAMKEGGRLTIRTSNKVNEENIHNGPEVMPPGAYVLIEVSDTGVGISKDNLPRIFEPFFSTKERGEGTGLGLSTVYGIVKQTGGFIFVDSEPGRGTTFRLYLPCHDGTEPDLTAKSAPAEESAGKDLTGNGVILLVEDEDAVRTFATRALRNKGYEVVEAIHGENALEVLEKLDKPLDLVISDVVMPGIDGPSLVRMLREQRPELKVIFISGYAEDTYRDELDEDNGVHFLPKPFSLKELAAKVKEVL